MIFISDILLNFLDGERLYEFFEWKEDDLYDHIKRIPLYRVNTKTLYDFIFKDVKCLSLEEIKGQTEVFKTRGIKKIEYAFVLCDIKKAVAFECDKKGNVIARSSLLLDEEEEVLEMTTNLDERVLAYKEESFKNDHLITRKENFIKNYLLRDIKYSYLHKDYSKLKYLYEEIFADKENKIALVYKKLTDDIDKNFSSKHIKIFNILKLINTK